MLEKWHVIDVLKRAKKAIREEDVVELKELSNQTIHSASVYQDADNVAIAVVLYALGKVVERRSQQSAGEWAKFEKKCGGSIDNAIIALDKQDTVVFRDQLANIRQAITGLSGNLKRYVEDVFRKASIHKASKLYEHGLSLETTARILGLTLWDLNLYVGQTKAGDVNLAYTLELDKRIRIAENLFKK